MINEYRLDLAIKAIQDAKKQIPVRSFKSTISCLNEALRQINKCMEENQLPELGEPKT